MINNLHNKCYHNKYNNIDIRNSSASKNMSFCANTVIPKSFMKNTARITIDSIRKYKEPIDYTWKHKKAFLQKEKELLGKNTLDGYLHDLDKLIMHIFFIPEKYINIIHNRFANHHLRNGKIKNIENAVIDWECARYTKLDKPLNARETYEKYYKNVPGVEEVLKKFNL